MCNFATPTDYVCFDMNLPSGRYGDVDIPIFAYTPGGSCDSEWLCHIRSDLPGGAFWRLVDIHLQETGDKPVLQRSMVLFGRHYVDSEVVGLSIR